MSVSLTLNLLLHVDHATQIHYNSVVAQLKELHQNLEILTYDFVC